MKMVMAVLLCGITALSAGAKVQSKVVEYKIGDEAFEGILAYDDAAEGKRPGVVVFHDWMGVGDYVKTRCEQLAGLGYVVFAPDIYGKGVRPANAKEAGEQASKYKADRKTMRERALAGLEQLKAQENVDTDQIAAIGYCFGGTVALELARASGDVRGVVTFHGGLDTPEPMKKGAFKGKILALHGADDPLVTQKDVAAFMQEMRDAGVDWELVQYGGAVHSFSRKDSGDDNSKGAAYNASADKRSWQAMKDFFAEIFGVVGSRQ